MLKLKIITPKKIVHEEDVKSVTLPSSEGELTILPRHTHLFCLLQEGILTYRGDGKDDYLAIGGGYMETDGEEVRILVSRAYGQDEIDEKITQEAIAKAQKLLAETKDLSQRREATALIRKSLVDMRLIKRRKRSL
jgi:F-type H+-transporting ATPase subunit epsilon